MSKLEYEIIPKEKLSVEFGELEIGEAFRFLDDYPEKIYYIKCGPNDFIYPFDYFIKREASKIVKVIRAKSAKLIIEE